MTWPPPLGLSPAQIDQLHDLERLALRFNEKLNLYSQASAAAFRERHLAHSLALASRPFPPGSVVADWGTGGGMPGLVLAIAFPQVSFHLIDSVGKKIRAVQTMARRLDLANVEAHHVRAERWKGEVTHSVSRATAPLETLWSWHERVSQPGAAMSKTWPSGLICLKGGDLRDEISALRTSYPELSVDRRSLPHWLDERTLEDKEIVIVTAPVSRETAERISLPTRQALSPRDMRS